MLNKLKESIKKFGKFLKKKMKRGHKKYRWFDVMELLVSAITLTAFCTISPILAEYQGKQVVYWTAVGVIALLVMTALWQIACLIGRKNGKKIFRVIGSWGTEALDAIGRWIHAPRFLYRLALVVGMGTCLIMVLCQTHSTKCYTAVTEKFGIPVGVGKPLRDNELKDLAEYWTIEHYWLRRTISVTHEDAYHENEIMGQYSSLYNMNFFQPVERMDYKYKKNRKKFKDLYDDKAYLEADRNGFREPTAISYYNGDGKLLLQMKKRNDSDTYDILTYAVDSEPQLFNSTLLRIPEEEDDEEGDNKKKQEKDEIITRNATEASVMSQAIEVTYNSDGLPETRRISPHIYNLCGVNGERYTYNENKQLTALYYLDINGDAICNQKGIMMVSFEYDEKSRLTGIRYFSDEKGEERIEGFQGVFCEKFEYDTDGNLCIRKQLNQSENRWYDKNGVCEYRYTYAEGRLEREEFLDFSGNMANNQNPNVKSTLMEFAEDRDEEGNKVITVSFDPVIRLAESNADVPTDKAEENRSREERQDIISVMSGRVIRGMWEDDNVDKKQDETEGQSGEASVQPVDESGNAKKVEKSAAAPEGKVADGLAAAEETAPAGGDTSRNNQEKEELPVRNYTKVCHAIDEKNNTLKISYYNDKRPVKNEQGFSVEQISYDSERRVEKKAYFDEKEKPCLTADGYSQVIFNYRFGRGDEKERIEYKNADEELAINNRKECGYAAVEYMPYENGENLNGNTIIELKYYDENNKPFLLPEKGYAKIRQTYNNRGLLIRETYHNEANGEEVSARRTDYMAAGIDYEYADDGNLICEVYKDASDQPVNRYDTGYAIRFQEFKNGKHVKTHYQGYMDNVLQDVSNKKFGIGSVEYVYANGREVEQRYFDINGNPILRSDIGCAILKKEYNNRGLEAAYFYYGTDGELILRKDTGYAVLRYQYDELGRKVLLHYFGVDQKPVISTEDHCAGRQYQYDEEGNRSDTRYLDVNDNLMTRRDLGYAWINRKYNEDGKVVEERYFDSDGQPVACKEGNYAIYRAFYKGQNPIRKEYRDGDNQLVLRQDEGYAVLEYEYDDDKCTLERMKGTDDKPVVSKQYQCAGFRHSYEENEDERRETTWYLDLDGNPMIRPDLGVAGVCKRYDKLGRLVREDYYDISTGTESQPKPILHKEGGYAILENKYDESGNCVRTLYKDEEGRLTLRKDDGYAVVRNTFDDFGRRIRVSYYGTDFDIGADDKELTDANQSALVFHAEYGCAEFRYGYDAVGNRTDISYAGTDGNVMVRRDLGFARVHSEYDEQGKLVAESYYDVDNNLAARREEGYASLTQAYRNGKCIEAVYYDTDGKPVLRKDQGFAMERWQYDELGQCVSDAFYDTEGKPVINRKYLCAAFDYEYDSRGNRTDIWYRDRSGKIMIRPDLGYAHERSEYDDRGNLIKRFYYDREECLTLAKESGIAYFENENEENGNCRKRTCYGKNRQIKCRKDEGYAVVKFAYDEYGRTSKIRYYGVDGKTPVLNPKYHCAGFLYEYEYDAAGYKETTKYMGLEDDKLMIREDLGYAQQVIMTLYDSKNNSVIERGCFLDTDGMPTAKAESGYMGYEDTYVCGKWVKGQCYLYFWDNDVWYRGLMRRHDKGYATIIINFDSFGQCISESYFDASDHAVCCLDEEDGAELCARIEYDYDEYGNTAGIRYKDVSGNMMIHRDWDYAQVRNEHDGQGNLTEQRHYDANNEPIARPGGFFSVSWFYDNGNCTETRYYDGEKELMMRSDENYAIQKDQYDEYGRSILSTYCNTEGEPVINTVYGCAGFEYKYDQWGNETDIIYRDTEGDMMVRERLGFAWIKMEYDEWGRLEVKKYFDAEQNPTADLKGCAEIRYEYDEQGIQHERAFDLNGTELQ